MATQAFQITAEQAAQQVGEMLRRQRTQRRLPKLSQIEQKIADDNQVYLFSVSPWPLRREMGSWGDYHIPACADNEEFVKLRPIPGIFTEPIPVNESTFNLEHIEGTYVAEQILGIGKMMPPSLSFVKFGVFIGSGKEPTNQELSKAKEALNAYFGDLVQEARAAFAQGPKEAQNVITERHRLAARRLGLMDEPWLANFAPDARKKCPIDGTFTTSDVLMCPTCQYIFGDDVKAHLDRIRNGRGK